MHAAPQKPKVQSSKHNPEILLRSVVELQPSKLNGSWKALRLHIRRFLIHWWIALRCSVPLSVFWWWSNSITLGQCARLSSRPQ